ncbi:MAG: MiaB/RimO family radical SAM methylthiotransferase [Bacillota bacterium]
MRTFYIATLGCKVNHYESEQIATLLRQRGLVQVHQPDQADLRVVNTCSVTVQAASKSRQTVRQLERLPAARHCQFTTLAMESGKPLNSTSSAGPRILIAGCWATSDKTQAEHLPGVTGVLGHHDNIAEELDRLLTLWQLQDQSPPTSSPPTATAAHEPPPESLRDDGWKIQAGTSGRQLATGNKSPDVHPVKENIAPKYSVDSILAGTRSLPLLDQRQEAHQRAFLKIQDGCDAHCTYCIIPRLRGAVWSKPVGDIVKEARRLVELGHGEVVLTGIFLGAYGQPTALRRRQPYPTGKPLAELIHALCCDVAGLRRLRLSSLEPGDLNDELLSALRAHPQVVPHFHLPLQSGSDPILRKMNRQYTRDDYLRMVDRLRGAFDRPALTTDIIVGFPGETDERFQETLSLVDQVGFLHIHAFSFSPRPGTAAARWQREFVRGPVVNERINLLRQRAREYSYTYRQQFVGQVVEVLVEHPSSDECSEGEWSAPPEGPRIRHGRCPRYFPVFFETDEDLTGRSVRVRIERVTPGRTLGTLVSVAESSGL